MAQKRKIHELDVKELARSIEPYEFIADLHVPDDIVKAYRTELLPPRTNISSEARVTLGALHDLLAQRHRAWGEALGAYELFTLNGRDDDEYNLEAARLLKEVHEAENRYLVQRVFFERLAFHLEGLVMFAEDDGGGVVPWSDQEVPWTRLLSRGVHDIAHPERTSVLLEDSSVRPETSFLLDNVIPDVVVCDGCISGNKVLPRKTTDGDKSRLPTGGERVAPASH